MSYPNHQSSSQSKQDFQDPKIILVASLLRQRDTIVAQINSGRAAGALTAMATLVSQLDIDESQEKLLKARKELTDNSKRGYLASTTVMDYFQIINDYLNLTYFAEYHGKAKPRVPTTPMLKVE